MTDTLNDVAIKILANDSGVIHFPISSGYDWSAGGDARGQDPQRLHRQAGPAPRVRVLLPAALLPGGRQGPARVDVDTVSPARADGLSDRVGPARHAATAGLATC